MKNRWALRLAALTLVSCLAMSGVSLAVEPGSATDPLVTLSYLNDVFLGQIMTKVDQKITARNSQLLQQSGGAGGMSGVEFAVVTLSKGQVLTGDIGWRSSEACGCCKQAPALRQAHRMTRGGTPEFCPGGINSGAAWENESGLTEW